MRTSMKVNNYFPNFPHTQLWLFTSGKEKKVHDDRHSVRLAGNVMVLHMKFMLNQQANDFEIELYRCNQEAAVH